MKKRKKKQSLIRYSFLRITTGSDLSARRLAVMKAQSPQGEGPVVWLTACVHGDEVGGIVVIQEIFKRLKKVPLRKGSLHAFPLMNPVGFEHTLRTLPASHEDINRSFPGDARGTLAERLAEKIFNTITATQPTLVVDLHNDWIRSIPYALIDPCPTGKKDVHMETLAYGRTTGLLMVNEQEDADDADDLRRSLSGSLLTRGIPALTLELGGSYVVNEKDVARGVDALWNILVSLDMVDAIESETPYSTLEEAKGVLLSYSHEPTAQMGGILRVLSRPGDSAKKGEPLARVYNVFGKLEETLYALEDCIILGYSDSSAVKPGEPIMAFGVLPKKR